MLCLSQHPHCANIVNMNQCFISRSRSQSYTRASQLSHYLPSHYQIVWLSFSFDFDELSGEYKSLHFLHWYWAFHAFKPFYVTFDVRNVLKQFTLINKNKRVYLALPWTFVAGSFHNIRQKLKTINQNNAVISLCYTHGVDWTFIVSNFRFSFVVWVRNKVRFLIRAHVQFI